MKNLKEKEVKNRKRLFETKEEAKKHLKKGELIYFVLGIGFYIIPKSRVYKKFTKFKKTYNDYDLFKEFEKGYILGSILTMLLILLVFLIMGLVKGI